MLNPADSMYPILSILERLSKVEQLLGDVSSRRGSEFQRAVVTVAGGGVQCQVEMLDGTLRTFGFLTSYTPVAGDQVLIALSPAWSGVLGKVSE